MYFRGHFRLSVSNVVLASVATAASSLQLDRRRGFLVKALQPKIEVCTKVSLSAKSMASKNVRLEAGSAPCRLAALATSQLRYDLRVPTLPLTTIHILAVEQHKAFRR
ncbi:hypothetical protein EVAR_9501_1 [Eumeta japonica]|uniref:Uncharacterized protein n=1 Tax=Eumeta variegata TaxID=151549 RepID=A0A4C1U3N5_EUMVA|nr:hypothetical protein EVAR_9501_1 [Eumeta japonica]